MCPYCKYFRNIMEGETDDFDDVGWFCIAYNCRPIFTLNSSPNWCPIRTIRDKGRKEV